MGRDLAWWLEGGRIRVFRREEAEREAGNYVETGFSFSEGEKQPLESC